MTNKLDLQIYFSARGLPLLYIGPLPKKPILTLENYSKWYGVELVNPDGTVTHVDPYTLDEVSKLYPTALMGDHGFQPHFLYRLAKHLDVKVDPLAINGDTSSMSRLVTGICAPAAAIRSL